MPGRAPRHPLRPLRRLMRGALLASGLLLAGAAAAAPPTASYKEPTTRYPHGVLGDDVEWGALQISGDRKTMFRLPQTLVFEDIEPRGVDLDQDGPDDLEWITVESHQDKGARLAIWDENGRITATPFIGRRNRWLAPVGAADLDGDGRIEIAYIDRPHLAKTLRLWRYDNGTLTEVASLPGLSNHKIGWDYITGGVRDCGLGSELVLAAGDWQTVRIVRFESGQVTERSVATYSPTNISQVLNCKIP